MPHITIIIYAYNTVSWSADNNLKTCFTKEINHVFMRQTMLNVLCARGDEMESLDFVSKEML